MTSQATSSPKLNIVPDTGFYIAAALKNGYARSYLVGRGSKFLTYELFSSEEILLEFQQKLEDKFMIDRAQTAKVLQQTRKVLSIVQPARKVTVARDPDDNKIIECALEAKAELLVAFDKDLLSLKGFEAIKIIHPSTPHYLFPPKTPFG